MTVVGPFWRQRPTTQTSGYVEWARCYLWLDEQGHTVAIEWLP